MNVHIEIGRPDHTVVIEAVGTGEDIAAELTAAVGVIYAQISQAEKSAGAEFRAALTAMVCERAQVWTTEETRITGGYGRCIVYVPPETEEANGED